ncbi:MAG: cobalamin B12-binding domain-containing protein [Pseudomonadota bacterium]
MTVQKKKLRVLIGKLGLDGHDRGAKIIARALRDAGMEVIFTGLRKTPQDITRIAVEEDVDVIGISLLSGAHETLLPELCRLLKENDAGDIAVIVGGIIPKDDIPVLKQAGVKAVFGPGDTTKEIIKYVRSIETNE